MSKKATTKKKHNSPNVRQEKIKLVKLQHPEQMAKTNTAEWKEITEEINPVNSDLRILQRNDKKRLKYK